MSGEDTRRQVQMYTRWFSTSSNHRSSTRMVGTRDVTHYVTNLAGETGTDETVSKLVAERYTGLITAGAPRATNRE